MAKAKIELNTGTIITIDGSADEINTVIKAVDHKQPHTDKKEPPAKTKNKKTATKKLVKDESESKNIIKDITALIHDSAEFQSIENNILDKKDRIAKILLCFKFANDLEATLTSSQVELITDQLGIKIASANIAKVIRLNAKKYLSGDKVRKQGNRINYRINRAGLKRYNEILSKTNTN
jgi:hypothetical protein